ncbi:MAG TPA: AgmX/PglI C-terminal domain-containing protein [Polyangiaceae bacterium]|nr:AgmX/PglI C-terminal domain-containing protein [Polyangiaceae bacterium]
MTPLTPASETGRTGRSSTDRPGGMTTVMRALAPPAGPRVLRIGLLVAGRIVDERIVRRRGDVTVGASERCTFVATGDAPPEFKLFELVDGHYALNVVGGMSGRVALASGATDLAALPVPHRLRLDERARGRVVVGDVSFLFQFVTAPPVQPRPQLPLAVKSGLAAGIDWRLTTIAAFSFLVHFGLVGAMYSDWTDPVVDDDITAGVLAMTERTAPEPPPVESRAELEPSSTSGPETPAATAAPRPDARGAKAHASTPDPSTVQDLIGSVERTRIAILVGLAPGRALGAAASADGEGAPVELGAPAARTEGVDNAAPGLLRLPSDSGPLGPRGSLQDLRPVGDRPAASIAGAARVVIPLFDVQYPTPTITVPMANAEAVIRSQIHPGARHCYQKGLDSDPTQSGRLVLEIRVGPSGEVDAVGVTGNTGLSQGVVDCIVQVARRAKFGRPGPTGSTLSLPFNFVRAHAD